MLMIKMKINNRKLYEVINDIVSKIADKYKVSPTKLILSYGVKPFLFNVYIGEQEIGQISQFNSYLLFTEGRTVTPI